MARSRSVRRLQRWGSAWVLLGLVAQWMLVFASTLHQASAAAAAGPWGQLCSTTGASSASPTREAPGSHHGASPCPVCGLAALAALPPAQVRAPTAETPRCEAVRRSDAPARTESALRPPARAPPRA